VTLAEDYPVKPCEKINSLPKSALCVNGLLIGEKKWSRDWDQVIYCSNAYRSGKYTKDKRIDRS
jgi:Uncharacterized protein conserved in bacteria (DUF2256)